MKNVYVTQPYLPPLKEFIPYLEKIWKNHILTNSGEFHQQLEKELCDYLGVKFVSLFANGTLALITALQALRISGEVITTPFSFVASTHCLHWNNIKPVFCDIEKDNFTINPEKIEALITQFTTAILPVHVYGNPCDHEKIKKIADKYKLKLIYDAAHAFGVKKDSMSICNWGDLSVLSFHATKVFNTFEGGAIVCHNENMKQNIDDLKNFGFRDEITIVAPGINAKMNEIQAAMGLLQLKYIEKVITKRKKIAEYYYDKLSGISGVTSIVIAENIDHNFSYFPVLIDKKKFGKTRDQVYEGLKMKGIYSRRYFYPLISHFSPYKELESANSANLIIAEDVAEKVLCLPIYPNIGKECINRIITILKMMK